MLYMIQLFMIAAVSLAWVAYARKVLQPADAKEATALRTPKTLQALMSIALKHGMWHCKLLYVYTIAMHGYGTLLNRLR